MSNNISEKVVIITGASSGIGLATAKLLASQGAVAILAARRKEKLDLLVNEITAAGGTARAFATDISKRADMEALIGDTIQGSAARRANVWHHDPGASCNCNTHIRR
jgi:NADP-dependent 3-hydroxy acid dehydrogenase YdfG